MRRINPQTGEEEEVPDSPGFGAQLGAAVSSIAPVFGGLALPIRSAVGAMQGPPPSPSPQAPAAEPAAMPQPMLPPAPATASSPAAVIAPPHAAREHRAGGGGAPAGPGSADVDRVIREEKTAHTAVAEAHRAEGQAAADAAALEVRHAEEVERRRAAIETDFKAELGRKQAQFDHEDQKYRGMALKDFWGPGGKGDNSGTRIKATLAVALSGLGNAFMAAAGRQTGPNEAVKMIDAIIERDYQQQKDAISKQFHAVELAKGNIEQVRQAHTDELHSLDNWRANAYAKVAAEGKQIIAKATGNTQAAQDNLITQTFDMKAIEAKAKLRNDAAENAARGAQARASLMNAQTNRLEFEAKRDAGGFKAPGEAGAGRAAGQQMMFAVQAEHGAAQLEGIDRLHGQGVELSADDKKLIQNNRSRRLAGQKAGGALEVAGRWAGIYPESDFKGLSPEKQELASRYAQLGAEAAGIQTRGGSQAEHELVAARERSDPFAAGISDRESMERIRLARGLVGASGGLGGKYTNIAQAGAAAKQAAAPEKSKPGISTDERAVLLNELQKNPADPRAQRIRDALGMSR